MQSLGVASYVCVWTFICTLHYIIHCIHMHSCRYLQDHHHHNIKYKQILGFDDNASMSIKKQRYASLCMKRREGVFRLQLKRYKFRPHQSNLHTEENVKIYYKVWTNLQSSVYFLNYNMFYKVNSRISLEFFHSSIFSFITIRQASDHCSSASSYCT